MSIRILHTADLHLNSAFSSLPPDKARTRREDGLILVRRIAEAAISARANAIFIAGDLFDRPDEGAGFSDAVFSALRSAGMPVFISPGNHDFRSLRSPYRLLPENGPIRVFSRPEMEKIETPLFDVWGYGFSDAALTLSPLKGFRAEKSDRPALGLIHADLNVPSSRYAPVSESDIENCGLSYLALGHVHKRGELLRAGETFYAYPGCPEGRGFDETGECGAYLVEISDTVAAQFLPLSGRRCDIFDISLTDKSDPLEAIAAALPDTGGRDVARVVLTGERETELPEMSEILSRISSKFFDVTVIDNSNIQNDLFSRAEEDTLTGQFLRLIRERLERAEHEDEREMILLAGRLGRAALEGREAPLS